MIFLFFSFAHAGSSSSNSTSSSGESPERLEIWLLGWIVQVLFEVDPSSCVPL